MMKRTIAVSVLFLLFVVSAGAAIAAIDTFETRNFPVGSTVIPVDDKQYVPAYDLINGALNLKVYGLLNLLSRKGITFFRIVEPGSGLDPVDAQLVTNRILPGPFPCNPGPCTYKGGPFVVEGPLPADVIAAFPTVQRDTLQSPYTWHSVVRVSKPNRILVIQPPENVDPPPQLLFDISDKLLDEMGIPEGIAYDLVYTPTVTLNPSIIFNYDVVIVDCVGWIDKLLDTPGGLPSVFRSFTEKGGELIFTDIAAWNMWDSFPETHPGASPNAAWWFILNYNMAADKVYYGWTVHPEATFLGQYFGPLSIGLYIEQYGYIAAQLVNELTDHASVLVDKDDFPAIGGVKWHAYANWYFPYGKGIVQVLGYHTWDVNPPPPQEPPIVIPQVTKNMIWQFAANKLLHNRKPDCDCCYMTGGAKIQGRYPYPQNNKSTYIDYGLTLHCNMDERPNSLSVRWGTGYWFTMTKLTQAYCSDNPDLVNGNAGIPFDTIEGTGTGSLNGLKDYKVFFKFTDSGGTGVRDWAYIRIEKPTGGAILEASGYINAGGQAVHQCTVTPPRTVWPFWPYY